MVTRAHSRHSVPGGLSVNDRGLDCVCYAEIQQSDGDNGEHKLRVQVGLHFFLSLDLRKRRVSIFSILYYRCPIREEMRLSRFAILSSLGSFASFFSIAPTTRVAIRRASAR